MKVILLKDVKKLGKSGEIVKVSDGYGSNYLIPNKLAVIYTEGSSAVLDKQNKAEADRQAELKAKAEENKKKLEALTLQYHAKSSKDGRMNGTISLKTVEQDLKSKYGIEIDKRKIVDKIAINAFGITRINIELYKGVVAEIKVQVSEE